MVGLARKRDGRIRHLPHLSRLRVPGQLARHRHPPHAACVRGRDGPQPATGWTARPSDAALPCGSAPRQRHTRPARSPSRRASHANAHRNAVSSGCSSRRRCRPPACCPGGALAIPSLRAESRGAGCGIRAGQAGRDEAQCRSASPRRTPGLPGRRHCLRPRCGGPGLPRQRAPNSRGDRRSGHPSEVNPHVPRRDVAFDLASGNCRLDPASAVRTTWNRSNNASQMRGSIAAGASRNSTPTTAPLASTSATTSSQMCRVLAWRIGQRQVPGLNLGIEVDDRLHVTPPRPGQRRSRRRHRRAPP